MPTVPSPSTTNGHTQDENSQDWHTHLLTSVQDIRALLERSHRIAVIGIKPDPVQPAFYVPEYAQHAGYEIIPVPVYYPELTEVLGTPIYRTLTDIPGDIDIANIFRRPNDVPKHLDEILAKRPKAIWMQLGITNDAVAEAAARAGIDVVQNRCLLVELQRIGR